MIIRTKEDLNDFCIEGIEDGGYAEAWRIHHPCGSRNLGYGFWVEIVPADEYDCYDQKIVGPACIYFTTQCDNKKNYKYIVAFHRMANIQQPKPSDPASELFVDMDDLTGDSIDSVDFDRGFSSLMSASEYFLEAAKAIICPDSFEEAAENYKKFTEVDKKLKAKREKPKLVRKLQCLYERLRNTDDIPLHYRLNMRGGRVTPDLVGFLERYEPPKEDAAIVDEIKEIVREICSMMTSYEIEEETKKIRGEVSLQICKLFSRLSRNTVARLPYYVLEGTGCPDEKVAKFWESFEPSDSDDTLTARRIAQLTRRLCDLSAQR